MSKKIIAVCCALVLVTALFASCGKKAPTITSGGEEREVALDEEGNTVVDSEGLVRVYVKDEKGEKLTNADGSYQYNYVKRNAYIANGSTLDTVGFNLTMPDGWEATDGGSIVKKGTDNTCKVDAGMAPNFTTGQSFQEYAAEETARQQSYINQAKANRPDLTIEMESEQGMVGEYPYFALKFKGTNENGELQYAATSVYFAKGEHAYLANYQTDAKNYDENFNFVEYFKQNVTIK